VSCLCDRQQQHTQQQHAAVSETQTQTETETGGRRLQSSIAVSAIAKQVVAVSLAVSTEYVLLSRGTEITPIETVPTDSSSGASKWAVDVGMLAGLLAAGLSVCAIALMIYLFYHCKARRQLAVATEGQVNGAVFPSPAVAAAHDADRAERDPDIVPDIEQPLYVPPLEAYPPVERAVSVAAAEGEGRHRLVLRVSREEVESWSSQSAASASASDLSVRGTAVSAPLLPVSVSRPLLLLSTSVPVGATSASASALPDTNADDSALWSDLPSSLCSAHDAEVESGLPALPANAAPVSNPDISNSKSSSSSSSSSNEVVARSAQQWEEDVSSSLSGLSDLSFESASNLMQRPEGSVPGASSRLPLSGASETTRVFDVTAGSSSSSKNNRSSTHIHSTNKEESDSQLSLLSEYSSEKSADTGLRPPAAAAVEHLSGVSSLSAARRSSGVASVPAPSESWDSDADDLSLLLAELNAPTERENAALSDSVSSAYFVSSSVKGKAEVEGTELRSVSSSSLLPPSALSSSTAPAASATHLPTHASTAPVPANSDSYDSKDFEDFSSDEDDFSL
jgi:hypothetical protein